MLDMDTEYTIEIDRPADEVWSILSDGFASVGTFLTAVPSSRAGEEDHTRVCETPFRGFSEVTETIVHHDDEAMSYTYTAGGVPRWLGTPRNTWFVEAIGEHRSRAGFRPEFDTTAFGAVALRLGGFDPEDLAQSVLEDLKYFAEHGEPSPAKRASMAGGRSI